MQIFSRLVSELSGDLLMSLHAELMALGDGAVDRPVQKALVNFVQNELMERSYPPNQGCCQCENCNTRLPS